MNTKMNKSQYDWYMMWFKRHVRSIVWDLENLPAMASEFDKDLTKAEREDLAAIMPEVKSMCISICRAYEDGDMDIRNYVNDLKSNFKNRFHVHLLFLARTEPAMSPDEEPTHYYNSLSVNFKDLHKTHLQQKLCKIACELADYGPECCQYIRDVADIYAGLSDEYIENVEPEDLPF